MPQRISIPRACEICGETFFPWRQTQRYCSLRCMGKSQQRPVVALCDCCGTEFTLNRGQRQSPGRRHFCSSSCRRGLPLRPLVPHSTDPSLLLVPLSGGGFATIDAADGPLVTSYSWERVGGTHSSYASTRIDGKRVAMHRLILQPPADLHVDHIDHDGLNNSRGNLRAGTKQQNCWNTRKRPQTTSRFKGVCFNPTPFTRATPWRAVIHVDGREFQVGFFATEEEAARAYDRVASETRGEWALLNFPDEEPSP